MQSELIRQIAELLCDSNANVKSVASLLRGSTKYRPPNQAEIQPLAGGFQSGEATLEKDHQEEARVILINIMLQHPSPLRVGELASKFGPVQIIDEDRPSPAPAALVAVGKVKWPESACAVSIEARVDRPVSDSSAVRSIRFFVDR